MMRTLDEVRDALFSWKEIDIAKTSNPVMGNGNPKSKIMFIGEAPGAKEDATGIPFVGSAGKLLATLLESIGLKREDVYVTNIVKFRPPENRDPTKQEKAACLPFLEEEIAIIQPKVLAPLGRHALAYFLPDVMIGDLHGKAHVLPDGKTIFPLYHPAAALHNPNLRGTLLEDFAALQKYLIDMKKGGGEVGR